MGRLARGTIAAALLGLVLPLAALAQDAPAREAPPGAPEQGGSEGQPADASAEEPSGYGEGGADEGGVKTEFSGEELPEDELPPASPRGPGAPAGEDGEGEGAGGEGAGSAEAQPARGDALQVIVIDAATYDIDPVVGEHVSSRMRTTLGEMGYEVLSREQSVEAAQKLQMPYPPAPADLWRVTWVAEAQRGAFARVWAHEGRYVVEITVASLDGTGPFFARGTSGAQDLHDTVARLTEQAMPPHDVWNQQEYERLTDRGAGGQAARQPPPAEQEAEQTPAGQLTAPTGPDPGLSFEQPEGGPAPGAAPEQPEEPLRRLSLAIQTEGAIGTTSDTFYNHLAGARFDVRITRNILVGAYVGYANLRGQDGRAHNLLAYGQVEHRVRLTPRSDVTIPLRFGIGYLPYNGPVIRLAAGVNVPLSDRVELGFDLLTPTFWVLPDRTAVSLNVAAELAFRL